MPQKRQYAARRTVTMYPPHWATVDAYAQAQGYGSTSAALRRIIDEWKALKAQTQPAEISA